MYGLPSADIDETHKFSATLRAHLSYRISAKSFNKCGKYGYKFIYAPK
jgi:hypothetical protein